MRTPRNCCLVIVAVALVRAQDLAPLRVEISNLARSNDEEDRKAYIGRLCDVAIRARLLDVTAVPDLNDTPADSKRAFQEILAFRRADVQNGSSGGASGSTSAVLSPLLPAIFGVGLETGSMTRTVSGTTITIKANPAGLFCVSGSQAAGVALRDDDACSTFWNRVGVTASFDTGRGEKKTELADLQTLDNQLAEFTVRAELLNHRKASGPRFDAIFKPSLDKWRKEAQGFADISAEAAAGEMETQLRDNLSALLLTLVKKDGYGSLPEAERVRQIEAAVKSALDKIQGEVSNLPSRRRAWLDSLRANAELRQAVDNASVLTAEYSLERPDMAKGVRAPDLQSLRLIFAKGWGDRKLDLTANAAASFFSDTRPGMRGAFRDFRAGAEAKWKLREVNNYGAPTLSFAALYVFLNQEPMGLGLVAFNQAKIQERGNIGLFQTKFEFPAAKNGIRIPLSFTYSNRTELIKESDVRAQVGVSFNLDTLFVPAK